MNKIVIGIMFIATGCAYGSLAFDSIYEHTLGFLVKNNWVKPPTKNVLNPNLLGRKGTIIFYSFILNIIGIYIIWNRNL